MHTDNLAAATAAACMYALALLYCLFLEPDILDCHVAGDAESKRKPLGKMQDTRKVCRVSTWQR
jgi:hypothetical protein